MPNKGSIFLLNPTPTYGFQSDISQDTKVANHSIEKQVLWQQTINTYKINLIAFLFIRKGKFDLVVLVKSKDQKERKHLCVFS